MTRKRPDVQPCGERHEYYIHCLICNPPPPERPEKLQGPEVGTLCLYRWKDNPLIVVRVVARSYVWGPGDPAYHGGARRYDWKVVDRGRKGHVVVDDKDLVPLMEGVTIPPWASRFTEGQSSPPAEETRCTRS